jgi:peptide/nickel transport system ATP-binding protein
VSGPLLEVKDLAVHFPTEDGLVRAVDGVSFTVDRGATLGVVGESGSGKSVSFLTVMGLISRKDARISGEILFEGENLLAFDDDQMRAIRGDKISMIFQDPLTALNPLHRVGSQITEALHAHREISKEEAWKEAVDLLQRVGIPRPEERARMYPHEFSGGMRQRAMIAMALSLNPSILIADEPTTALDVTVQAQILELIARLKEEFNTAVIMITHDLGVVAQYADTVQVMYAGRIVESGNLDSIFHGSLHPYTWGLLQSISRLDEEQERLRPIKGSPPSLIHVPPGCPFHPRCPYVFDRCKTEVPPLSEEELWHLDACYLPIEEKRRIFQTQVAARA